MAHIAVIGLGYVGLTSALGLSNLGHSIVGIDIDENRLEHLRSGKLPIHEPGLEGLLFEAQQKNKVVWESSYNCITQTVEFAFVCVSTPTTSTGEADLSNLNAALHMLENRMPSGSIIVIRSTVPIGTTETFIERFSKKDISLSFNPEFFSEGNALTGFNSPNRIVVGAESETIACRVLDLYQKIDCPKVVCDLTAAETIKHASNSYLALRLSFVNELAMLCEVTGASYRSVAKGIGLDSRIGSEFLSPGPGWGGSCFPKDTQELIATSTRLGSPMKTVKAAFSSNEDHILNIVRRIVESMGGEVSGKKIAVWGLAFKAGTDDTRESPAIRIALDLARKGALITAYDPAVRGSSIPGISISPSNIDACIGVEALLVLTEWPEFARQDPLIVNQVMRKNSLVLDFRDVLDENRWGSAFNRFWKIAR